MPKPTLCLNMIVKDESHVIAETLDNLLSYFPITYWVICDTGSTDGTQQLIRDFFEKKEIPGELHEDPWKDFGHNRTLAVERAQGKADYILFFDADDRMIGNFVFPDSLELESYNLYFGPTPRYERSLLVRGDVKWKWNGVLHEYVGKADGTHPKVERIEGDYYVHSGKSGNRSKTPDLYLRDAEVLEKAFREEEARKGHLQGRYAYYCGQSYKDSGRFEKAVEWYQRAARVSGWDEEAWHSAYQAGFCMMRCEGNISTEAVAAQMMIAWMRRPWRIEPIFDLAMLYKSLNMWHQAYVLFASCAATPPPVQDRLFVQSHMYEGVSIDEFSVAAYWVGRYEESRQACLKLLNSGMLRGTELARVQKNLWYAERALGNYSPEKLEKFLAEKKKEVKHAFPKRQFA